MLRFDVALQALRKRLKTVPKKAEAGQDAPAGAVLIPFPARKASIDARPAEKRRKAR